VRIHRPPGIDRLQRARRPVLALGAGDPGRRRGREGGAGRAGVSGHDGGRRVRDGRFSELPRTPGAAERRQLRIGRREALLAGVEADELQADEARARGLAGHRPGAPGARRPRRRTRRGSQRAEEQRLRAPVVAGQLGRAGRVVQEARARLRVGGGRALDVGAQGGREVLREEVGAADGEEQLVAARRQLGLRRGEQRDRAGEPAVGARGLAHADPVVRRQERERRRGVEREPHAVGRVVARVLAQHALADGHGPGDLAALHEQPAEVGVQAPARRARRARAQALREGGERGRVPRRHQGRRVLADRVRGVGPAALGEDQLLAQARRLVVGPEPLRRARLVVQREVAQGVAGRREGHPGGQGARVVAGQQPRTPLQVREGEALVEVGTLGADRRELAVERGAVLRLDQRREALRPLLDRRHRGRACGCRQHQRRHDRER
jgi:hypothetical protein